MPHVASKASVLKAQHSGLTQRERMPETRDSSPFSILLADTGSEAAPARPRSSRPLGCSTATQRGDAPRSQMLRSDASHSQQTDEENATDAPEAAATEAAATEQAEGGGTDQFEIAAAGQAAATPELPTQPTDSTSDASEDEVTKDEVIKVDATLAAVVETPPPPQQPVATDTPWLAVAVTPTAAAPTDPGTVESAASAGVTAAAPASATPAVTSDAGGGASEPAPEPALPQVLQAAQAPQAPQTPKTPQAPEPTAHPAAAPMMPQAKAPPVEPTATPESANLPQPSTTPDTATAVAPVAGAEQAEIESASEQPAHVATPSQPSARPDRPDAAERPQTASAVSDFVLAAQQPTPDSSHLAHLQTGREFGQTVAATAHASQSADASNSLASAPVPLESLAVEIATRAQGGRNRFEIRLDPPELGRIDVRLDIDRGGNVTSRLVVEKAETLDILRRDAHQLERALQDAGLKTSDNSLQFSLRDQSSAERNDRNDSNNPRILVADPELPVAEAAPAAYGLTLRGGTGIDIRV